MDCTVRARAGFNALVRVQVQQDLTLRSVPRGVLSAELTSSISMACSGILITPCSPASCRGELSNPCPRLALGMDSCAPCHNSSHQYSLASPEAHPTPPSLVLVSRRLYHHCSTQRSTTILRTPPSPFPSLTPPRSSSPLARTTLPIESSSSRATAATRCRAGRRRCAGSACGGRAV